MKETMEWLWNLPSPSASGLYETRNLNGYWMELVGESSHKWKVLFLSPPLFLGKRFGRVAPPFYHADRRRTWRGGWCQRSGEVNTNVMLQEQEKFQGLPHAHTQPERSYAEMSRICYISPGVWGHEWAHRRVTKEAWMQEPGWSVLRKKGY